MRDLLSRLVLLFGDDRERDCAGRRKKVLPPRLQPAMFTFVRNDPMA
jgi:hypothetical protein